MPTATSTECNYSIGPDGVFYEGARVSGADAGSFFVSPTFGFEDAGMDRTHFFYGTTTLGAVADFSLIPPPTFSTSTARFAITIIHHEALMPSGCASVQSTGSCAPRVTVSYPQITGTTSPAITRINAQLKREGEARFADAFRVAKNNPRTTDSVTGYEGGSDVTGWYTPEKYPFITFRYSEWDYWPGAAHANGHFYFETYNLVTGSLIAPRDTFIAGSDYGKRTIMYLDEAYLAQEQANVASPTYASSVDCTPGPLDPRTQYSSSVYYDSYSGEQYSYFADNGVVVASQGETYPCSEYELDTVIPFSYLLSVLSPTGPLQNRF